MGDWKLIRRMWNSTYELYQIDADPYETTNLATSRADIVNALQSVVELEGVLEEPYFVTGNTSAGTNVFYTQYKAWSPQAGSSDFGAAGNWSGGTQRNRTDDPDAKYWNTGPGPNWLATVANTSGGFQNAAVTADAKILGIHVRADAGSMQQVTVATNVTLEAYNGVRIGPGGILQLVQGTLTTAKEVEIQAGGKLVGAGEINGYQDVIAGIPEFAGKRLLEPEVRNAGLIDIYRGSQAGLLTINGDFEQTDSGKLYIDVFGAGVGGTAFDKLVVSGAATLQGSLVVELAPSFVPLPGQTFSVLSAESIVASDLQLSGPDARWFNMSVIGGTDLVLTFASADFDGNGFVNADDLLVWQDRFGGVSGGQGDADADGDIDGADFLSWQRQLGSISEIAPIANVPEPSALAMGASMLIAMALSWKPAFKRRRGH
jgi:hypothetical protein